ncbi:hypothetical protein F5J12DRAFT_853124 [Pisolithus orientalis]|uniref:uncharacterized protein n=1 Tax=Pisolithus orientalis TaxID=936130 RepID=UPI0022253566|nr:uncharacterized protein F5J12DRAFT_853124 [Pisolithus orientalis]KAI5996577.1 hypothetical protein F5J12DRAFT_853124 [Pisolithus orientalis]
MTMTSSKETPFPSPGSSFLPPPIPVAHEFALLRKHSKDGDLHQDDPGHIPNIRPSASPPADDVDPPNGVVSPIRVLTLVRSFLPRFIDLPQNSPHTPSEEPPTTLPSSGFAPTPTSCQSIHDVHRLSTHSTTSLTSSRPAPPSPVISRRASGRRSRPPSGTTTSRPPSTSMGPSSLSPSTTTGRRPKDISNTPMSCYDLDTPLSYPSSQPRSLTTPTPHLICIRDYAFPSTDVRFSGNGPHVPRPNRPRVLARKLRKRTHSSTSTASTTSSTTTTTTSSENGDGGNDDDDSWGNQNGWGAFRWGWGIPPRMGMSSRNASDITSPDVPSRSDLDRNFEADSDSDAEYLDVEEDFPADSADLSFSQADEDEDEDLAGDDLLPGLYRALYPFEPEGTAEMRLEEDQVVRVLGRGGGVGWAVVVKDGLKDAGLHALVPESYLEVLKLDCEGEDDVDPNVDYETEGRKMHDT